MAITLNILSMYLFITQLTNTQQPKTAHLKPSSISTLSSISVSTSPGVTITNDKWHINVLSQQDADLTISLNNEWAFHPTYPSSIQLYIQGETTNSTYQKDGEIVFVFSVNNQYFAQVISLDKRKTAYKECPNSNTPLINRDINEMISSLLPDRYHRFCKNPSGTPINDAVDYWNTVSSIYKQPAKWPMLITIMNNPILNTITYTWTDSFTGSNKVTSTYTNSFDTNQGLNMYISGESPFEHFLIFSVDVTYAYYTPNPTKKPTFLPSISPTQKPTFLPTINPSNIPTNGPTMSPTNNPTRKPTVNPTYKPSVNPTSKPTNNPTYKPTINPTNLPTISPTLSPIKTPTFNPSNFPSKYPTKIPTNNPTITPTKNPSNFPTISPTLYPTNNPTTAPTKIPTKTPTKMPSNIPTNAPTKTPTNNPTLTPTFNPSINPTANPTLNPSSNPSNMPTVTPTLYPTVNPTINPSLTPTYKPTPMPTPNPTPKPTPIPSPYPTIQPSMNTISPSVYPTFEPTNMPSTTIIPTTSASISDSPTMVPTDMQFMNVTSSTIIATDVTDATNTTDFYQTKMNRILNRIAPKKTDHTITWFHTIVIICGVFIFFIGLIVIFSFSYATHSSSNHEEYMVDNENSRGEEGEQSETLTPYKSESAMIHHPITEFININVNEGSRKISYNTSGTNSPHGKMIIHHLDHDQLDLENLLTMTVKHSETDAYDNETIISGDMYNNTDTSSDSENDLLYLPGNKVTRKKTESVSVDI